MLIDFLIILIAIASLAYLICIISYPDITLYDTFDLIHKRVKTIKQQDADHRHTLQPSQTLKIDTTFIISLTTNYMREIQLIIDFLTKYKEQHELYNIQLIIIVKYPQIQNRSFINITTNIVNLLNVVVYNKDMTTMERFATAVMRSTGNIVYLHDFEEFPDLEIYNTFMAAFSRNHKQMVIATRAGSKTIFTSWQLKLFPIINIKDDFAITRLLTKEAAHKIFSNMHIHDEFFTVEANKLAKLTHCKIRSIILHRFNHFEEPQFSTKTKLLRLLQIGYFYKINIWTYKRMADSFITQPAVL